MGIIHNARRYAGSCSKISGREGGRDVKFTEIRLAQCAKLGGKISLPNKNITYYNGREQELLSHFLVRLEKFATSAVQLFESRANPHFESRTLDFGLLARSFCCKKVNDSVSVALMKEREGKTLQLQILRRSHKRLWHGSGRGLVRMAT